MALVSGVAWGAAPKDESFTFEMVGKGTQKMGNSTMPQTLNGKFSVKGNKSRVEMSVNGQSIVMLMNDKGMFMLNAQQKMALKLPTNNPAQRRGFQEMLVTDPRKALAEMKKQGAKKVSSEKVNGVACDVYAVTPPGNVKQTVKTWVRQSDSMPAKVEVKGDQGDMLIEFKNIKKGVKLEDSVFSVPAGYQVQEFQMPNPNAAPGGAPGAPKKR
jgi:outer membrane lipoprotein-sorting protein